MKYFQNNNLSVLSCKAGFNQLTDNEVDCFPGHIFKLLVMGKVTINCKYISHWFVSQLRQFYKFITSLNSF